MEISVAMIVQSGFVRVLRGRGGFQWTSSTSSSSSSGSSCVIRTAGRGDAGGDVDSTPRRIGSLQRYERV